MNKLLNVIHVVLKSDKTWTRLELRARSELDLMIVDVGVVIVLNSIPQQAELLSQVR